VATLQDLEVGSQESGQHVRILGPHQLNETTSNPRFMMSASVCVCVCVCERERETVCVCGYPIFGAGEDEHGVVGFA
jgi:hypothetical protein